ncbi:MAG: phosphomannomutase/phosphoglucomutase [Clostridia bacterium]|nr:phosphomannomutase/phosphoglucomutase [Clostridia bacterium]
MSQIEWKKFKSGTDVRAVALDGVPGEPCQLTDEVVNGIVAAFALWVSRKAQKAADALTVAVGRDSRLSGPRIRDAVVAALQAAGVRVLDCGLASTPAMFMTTVDLGCDAAVQITASHHPWNRNGLKFFLPTGGIEGSDLSEILALAAEDGKAPSAKGTVEQSDYMQQYAARLRRLIIEGADLGEQPLNGLHIVVDAGNGVGGFYATEVLQPLGATVTGSQFLEPDGRFPNHIPNPENAEAMASVCGAVQRVGADLGIIFDTDVDRAGCVGADGREINRNRLVALAAAIALEGNAGGTIVTDSVTSDGLKQFIEQTLGGVHCRFKRGYKNVINESIRLNREGVNSPLAIETSGHAALRDNYFLDDGAYLVTRIIIKAVQLRAQGKTLDDLIAALPEPAEGCEVRFTITEPDFRSYGERVLADLEAYSRTQGWRVADDSREGVRVSLCDGWFLLRLSVHDPVMPLNVESNTVGGCEEILQCLLPFIEQQHGLRR